MGRTKILNSAKIAGRNGNFAHPLRATPYVNGPRVRIRTLRNRAIPLSGFSHVAGNHSKHNSDCRIASSGLLLKIARRCTTHGSVDGQIGGKNEHDPQAVTHSGHSGPWRGG